VATTECTSRSLQLQQARERDAAERVQAAQARQAVETAAQQAMHQRIAGLGNLLAKLQAAAGGAGADASIQQLLPALSPTERGRLLENLWRVTPNRHRTRALVVAAGQELFWFVPGALQPERRVAIPEDLGGLRSIGTAASGAPPVRELLVGAGSGVWRVHAEDGSILAKYSVPGAGPQRTGFNAVAAVGDWLYATHSGLGCRRWRWGAPTEPPHALLTPVNGEPRVVRALVVADGGEVLFAADEVVHVVRTAAGESEPLFEAATVVHALEADGRNIYAGTADGMLLRTSLDASEDTEVIYRAAQPIESIGVRRWVDLVELVLPGPDGVMSLFGDEAFAVRMMPSGVPVRRVWTADDALAAVPEARDRVLVQTAASAGVADLAIGRLTGRSVQDVCFLAESG
jgi:hypothetical protein